MRAWRLLAALVPVLLAPALTVATPAVAAHAQAAASRSVTASAAGGGIVKVDEQTDLVNQTVHVSWKGFKPSNNTKVVPSSTMYVVRVYQCRGAAPASPKDCYGSSVYTYDGQSDRTAVLPDGPSNARDAITAPDGTGGLDVEVRTSLESSTLGCTATSACSLVVVPNNGNPKQPALDQIYATNAYMDSAWAWANHVAIPLHLAPAGAVCPLGVPGVTTLGSPMLQRSLTSWQPAACSAASPVAIDYTAISEPEARAKYESGGADVGLTTLPATADDGDRPTAYAPLAISGVTVAFHIDDATTGQPITSLKLSPRLVAKLITESYRGGNADNPATADNPYSIYQDKEFLALNPGHAFPQTDPTSPLLVSGNTDLVYELTRWLNADAATRAWLDGTPDAEQGMHVNTFFKGIDYPASALETRDPYPAAAYTFVPINGLDHVARALVADTPSSSSPVEDPITHTHPKDPQQPPGSRGLIAIIDTADAAAFSLPMAQLRNAAGAFVAPDAAGLTAAESHMLVDAATGTRTVDVTSTDAAAYPLTMVQYAMVPTGDLDADKTDQVLRFLAYASGPGQQPGHDSGELPGGYLPLTPDLMPQLASATTAVRTQSGTPPPPVTPTTGATTPATTAPRSSTPTGSRLPTGTSPTSAAAPVVAPAPASAEPSTVPQSLTAASFPGTPAQRGPAGLVLPAILILTLLAGLGGPLLLTKGTVVRTTVAGWGAGLWARWTR